MPSCYKEEAACKDYTRQTHLDLQNLMADIEQDIRQSAILRGHIEIHTKREE